MAIASLLLLVLFFLTIAHLVTLKICSVSLDHRTAPLFISGWTLLGLLTVSPVYGHLWDAGWAGLSGNVMWLGLTAIKAGLLYLMFVVSQQLMQVSLSSRHYVTPLSVGLIAILNSFLGEHLAWQQWFAALGLCALAGAFFFKGHMADMDRTARLAYAKLVGIAVIISGIDQAVLPNTNWFAMQAVCNGILLAISLGVNARQLPVLRAAFLSRPAALAGFFYAATELVKYYQMITINPVSVIAIVQALTKPVILVLSALIWRERTVKEQLVWGVLALIIALPLFFR